MWLSFAFAPGLVRTVASRTDGPSLNRALAQAGRLLAAFSVLVSAGLLLCLVEIERLEVVPYALPFREPYVTARGRLERRALVLVRLHAGGLVGLGETTALSLRGGDAFTRIVDELRTAAHALAAGGAQRSGGVSMQTLAAIEIALLDLKGKASRLPVWRVLGAAAARPIECNATLTAGAPADVARQAVTWAERGFRTFKLKVGMDGDLDQLSAARAALPEDAVLRIDANGAWSVDEAAARLAAMRPLELAEQPVATAPELHDAARSDRCAAGRG